eukprot:scaffold1056_cov564-Prasinococcus_capsulatus_cf.AAC.15
MGLQAIDLSGPYARQCGPREKARINVHLGVCRRGATGLGPGHRGLRRSSILQLHMEEAASTCCFAPRSGSGHGGRLLATALRSPAARSCPRCPVHDEQHGVNGTESTQSREQGRLALGGTNLWKTGNRTKCCQAVCPSRLLLRHHENLLEVGLKRLKHRSNGI